MAVLVEAFSVIVRRDAIDQKLWGGWAEFVGLVPNQTLCYDKELARVGFMAPRDVQAFIEQLQQGGLTFENEGKAQDMAVVDQLHGSSLPVDWLEIARIPFGEAGEVAACWLYEGPRTAGGIDMPASEFLLVTPEGWSYEQSLSADYKFVPNGQVEQELEFLRNEDCVDVYMDRSTGREVFVGRPEVSPKPMH